MAPQPPKPPSSRESLYFNVRWKPALAGSVVVGVAVVLLLVLLSVWVFHPISNTNPCSYCGTAFALSPATEQGGPGAYWYNFSVQGAAGSLALGELWFQVQTSTGAVIALANASLTVFDVGAHGSFVGSYSFATSMWTSGGSTTVTNLQQFDLQCSNGLRSQGDVFLVLGHGSFTGSVTVSIP